MKKSLSSIKYYFAVDQTYVLKKLCLLLFPFRPRVKKRIPINENLSIKFFILRIGHWDIVLMNLYHHVLIQMHRIITSHVLSNYSLSFIILSILFLVMSAITYVLVAGLVLGTQNR
jgi:uncharacterized oligopeptide transporter (OPT) family protein